MNLWLPTNRADPAVARLADDHYSRQRKGHRQFSPPGQVIVLYIPGDHWPFRAAAGWVWHRPHPDKAKRMDGYDGWYNCSFFRNESEHLSSELVEQAIEWALYIWGPPECGYDTYVMPSMIKSPNPGYCFQVVGWAKDGWSSDGKKRRLYLSYQNTHKG